MAPALPLALLLLLLLTEQKLLDLGEKKKKEVNSQNTDLNLKVFLFI